jgi:pyruvate formate lyase activating enzyme
MVRNLGPDTPLHLSRFSPRYRLKNLPPTPEETLVLLADVAREQGLRYVYVGNVYGAEGQSTFCPHCDELLVERRGYSIGRQVLGGTGGECPRCATHIAGVWS